LPNHPATTEILVVVNLASLVKIGFNLVRRMRKSGSGARRFLLASFLLAVILGYHFQAVAAEQEFAIEPAPNWISFVTIATNANPLEESASSGIFVMLLDTEINGGTKERYLHIAEKFLSTAGVEANSRLSFSFDPAYEKLILHKIVIHRGSEILDQLDPAKIRVIQQEKDLDRLIYNGARTAFLFLEDVRVGDWVEFAYTIRGRSPLGKGHFYDSMQLRWSFPIQTENYRLLWPRTNQPLWVQPVGDVPRTRGVTAQFYDYAWRWENRPGQEFEDFVAPTALPYALVHFTDYQNWEDVAIWAGESFRAQPPSKDLKQKVLEFQSSGSTPEERVVKALQFVQDEIRYLGIENGVNSHQPTDPSIVLARGYGDCKDKALLFCTILHSLDVEASPVLVSTRLKARVKGLRPTPWMFDHVIVQVLLPGKTNYVDVTRTFQRGALDKRYVDDFRAGVLLSESSPGLIDIPFTRAGFPKTTVDEFFKIPTNAAPTKLTIEKVFEGSDADYVRQQLATTSRDSLNKSALAYYRKFYPEITSTAALVAQDNPDLNRIRIVEYFEIPKIWAVSPQQTNYISCSFFADGIRQRLYVPSKKERKQPLMVPFPENYLHRIVIDTPEVWQVNSVKKEIQNKAFVYQHRTTSTNNRVFFVNQIVTLAPGVVATDVPAYVDALDQIPDNFLTLTINKPIHTRLEAGAPNWAILSAVLSYSTVLVMLAIMGYRFKFKHPPLIPAYGADLQGLGGWLILVGFGLFSGILVRAAGLAKIIPAFSGERWQVVTNPASPSYSALRAPVLIFELFNWITLFALLILLIVTFFQKKRVFPALFITFLSLQFLTSTLDVFLVYWLHQSMTTANTTSAVMKGPLLLATVLWTLYMLRSQRVKLTFVN
jgi:transglutaminase-like putative cysteine protease